MMELELSVAGQRFRMDLSRAHDLSIGLRFDGPQPSFFGAAPAHAEPLQSGTFRGAVSEGGSCNCSTYTLTPHCNGTHTECAGHVTRAPMSVRDVAPTSLLLARVVSVQPCTATGYADDLVITQECLAGLRLSPAAASPASISDTAAAPRKPYPSAESAAGAALGPVPCTALIVRTLPNPADKRYRRYSTSESTPYFTTGAMEWIVERDIRHLVVDLPSVDRMDDGGQLPAHRIFWGMPAGSTDEAQAARSGATLTELAYIDDGVADGFYLLNLQVAPFETDAAPSRPLLYPLTPSP